MPKAPAIKNTPYLSSKYWDMYEKYKAIRVEKKRINARMHELKEKEDELDALLKDQFPETCPFRRLPGGLLLERQVVPVADLIGTPEMVGSVIRKGYSYPNYREIEG